MAIFPFNFQRQFADDVRHGRKRQTVRRNRADGRRPVPGDTLKLYTGLRTSATTLLLAATCTECQAIRIDLSDRTVIVDGEKLAWPDLIDFAKADGFENVDAFFGFFIEQYGGESVLFEGFLTKWSPEASHV